MPLRTGPFVLAALPALLLLGACSTNPLLPGNDETDRIAQVVADAISWPRQDTVLGYARAAAGTSAAEDGRLTVIGVEELEADQPEDPLGVLMFRVHLEGSTSGFVETEPVTACYRAELDYSGVVGPPVRTSCPDHAEPVDIPPAPQPEPVAEVGESADRLLGHELRTLPASPDVDAITRDLEAALPVVRDALPSEVDVLVEGGDVGVAARGEDDCLLGARIAGRVRVWRPADVQLQPGELTCDAGTALGLMGLHPPH